MSERLQRNQRVIEEFRANAGVVQGDFAGVPLLLVTTRGARSGEPRTMPLTYLRDGDRFAVFAANGGRAQLPGWYHNLMADPSATVEVGTETLPVTASVVEGADRDRLWDLQVRHAPYFADFQARAGRVVPVVALTPVTG